jgi:dihydroneopterin aldolase
MQIETGVSLKPYNTFGLPAVAQTLVRVASAEDIRQVVDYEVVFLAIRKLEGNAHCECLESSILELMDAIFGISIVTSAYVSMQKPHVYNGQATPAISLSLTREQWAKTKG